MWCPVLAACIIFRHTVTVQYPWEQKAQDRRGRWFYRGSLSLSGFSKCLYSKVQVLSYGVDGPRRADDDDDDDDISGVLLA